MNCSCFTKSIDAKIGAMGSTIEITFGGTEDSWDYDAMDSMTVALRDAPSRMKSYWRSPSWAAPGPTPGSRAIPPNRSWIWCGNCAAPDGFANWNGLDFMIEGPFPTLSKQDAIDRLAVAGEPHASRYRAKIDDIEAEVHRLTEILKKGGNLLAVKVRLQALGSTYWPAALLEFYKQARRAEVRRNLVKHAIFEARESEIARHLGLVAMNDRSYTVRYRAYQVLAYSLDRSVLPALHDALKTEDRPRLRRSIENAIDAINRQNHQRFISRTIRPGRTQWMVQPWDSDDALSQHASLIPKAHKIRKGWKTKI